MYRPEWWEATANGRGITQIACDLVASVRGSFDRPNKSIHDDAYCVAWVLDNWQEPEDAFDNAVHYLLTGAFAQYREWKE